MALLVLGWTPRGHGSDRGVEPFVARTWHVDHGLPQNTVQAFCHARDGFLWLGTRFGLARFDGHVFQTFRPTEIPAFRDGSITSLAEDAEGTLWIATHDGLIRHRQGRFERLPVLDGERIWAVWAERPGRLWLGLHRGLALLEGDRIEWIAPPAAAPEPTDSERDGLGVRSLAPDGTRALVVTTHDAWFRLDLASRRLEPWTPRWNSSGSPPTSASAPDVPPEWRAVPIELATEQDLIRRVFTTPSPGPRQWGPRTFSDLAGGWWFVAADRRLYRIDANGGAFEIVGPRPLEETVLTAHTDRDGNHWIGTAVAGAVRLRSRLFDPVQLGSGRDAPCFTVSLDAEGNAWTATRSSLVQVRGNATRSWKIAGTDIARQIHSLAPTADGGWWIGWERRGLFRWHPESDASMPVLVDFAGDRPRALYTSRDGALWIGLASGVARRFEGVTRRFGTADGLPHADIRAVHEDRAGNIWVGTFGGGIARLDRDRFVPRSTRDGLGSDTVWGFYEDSRNALWIYGLRGLTRFQSNTWSVVTREHGLFDDLTNQMIEDDSGHVWLGCNRGIYRLETAELHAVADRRLDALSPVVFGAADGLPVAETNGENQPAAARGADGVLWFPTPVGLLRVDSRRAPTDETAPRVHLTHLRTESLVIQDAWGTRPDLDRDGQGEVRIPPGRARVLEAEFTAPHFLAPERIQFRHRLVGYEEHWSEADSRRTIRYTNLRPGRYRLEITACNSHGVWSSRPALFAFRVSPFFYQTPTFAASALAAIALALLVVHRLRLRIATQRQILETELRLARERERIARDMHDDVGASLTQIAFLTARAQSMPSGSAPDLPALMGRIAGTTRDAAQAMDEIVWALNPRNDRLDHLAGYICQYAREFLEPTGVRCRLDFPGSIPPYPVSSEDRHHILMIVKEALHNTVRHAGASEVWIALAIEAEDVALSLTDDGRGFEAPPMPASGIPSTSTQAHSTSEPLAGSQNGLHSMAHRISMLGGTLRITCPPAGGTRVLARWPLPRAPRSWD